MSIREEIDILWNQEGLPLEKFYDQAIKILKKGLDTDSEIPHDLLIEILVSANTSLGYGGAFDEAKVLFQAFSKVINDDNLGSIPKIHRFACLLVSVTLTLISVDEVSTKKELSKILEHLNIDAESGRISILKSLFIQLSKIIDNLKPNYWSLEFLSFMTMLKVYIDEYGDLDEHSNEVWRKLLEIHKNWKDSDFQDLQEWKNRWLEANDYFRLNGMLIFGNPPSNEEILLEALNQIYPQ